jgi:hypothetical protein
MGRQDFRNLSELRLKVAEKVGLEEKKTGFEYGTLGRFVLS